MKLAGTSCFDGNAARKEKSGLEKRPQRMKFDPGSVKYHAAYESRAEADLSNVADD